VGFALLAAAVPLLVGGARLEVVIEGGRLASAGVSAVGWVEAGARAVAAYYGHFPVERARVVVQVVDGMAGVGHGTALGGSRPQVRVALGRMTEPAMVADDWVMTHELVHLGFPSLPERHHWMEEGLATYVEPLARARAGELSAERVWGDLVRDLPQGLPRAGDRGLDFTPTWGRTYWGGALYFLLADVEIRQRTGGARGLEDALRAIAAQGGTIKSDWTIDRVLATGDAATGTTALRELYDRMKDRPAPVDLADLWRRLGVTSRDGQVRFDDAAPLARVRRAITTGAPR
jgi:hypothetical protein